MVIFVGVAGCGRGPPPNGLLRRARLSSSVGPLFRDRIVTYAATTLAKLVSPSTAIFLTTPSHSSALRNSFLAVS